MNLELLEEIHSLLDDGNSISDIAMSLGMQKNMLLVCLRMEKLISNKYEDVINENSSLIYDLKLLENEKGALIEEIESLNSLNEVKLIETNSNLESDILSLKESIKLLQNENIELEKKYETIPVATFINNNRVGYYGIQ